MCNFDDTVKVNTVFGLVEIVYERKQEIFSIPDSNNFDAKPNPTGEWTNSKYVATVVDGRWAGWSGESKLGRNTAVKELLLEIIPQYSTGLGLI
jgi:hypothetical protein